ncbi:hypothetical protein GW813_11520 [bacterium]|nr:hypothetical protein [bacterium]PJA75401.1 MAG: hypothetical protein CO151_06560 [bacterium CG_4_9_14_3_um_filter_65_15]
MKNPRRLMLITALCGLLSLVAFILGRLAMTDIYHGEPDLDLEWTIVAVTFVPVLAFHLLAVFAAFVAMRRLGNS